MLIRLISRPHLLQAYNAAGGRTSGTGCVVTVYAVGDAAEAVASLPAEARVAEVAAAVGRSPAGGPTSGGTPTGEQPLLALSDPKHITQGVAKVWSEDSSSRGAYAYFRPGQITVRACCRGAVSRVRLCSHLPLLRRQADSFVRSAMFARCSICMYC